MNDIVLKLPLCSNNLLCARLTASAVSSLMNINVDDAEDIKICVNEACLILIEAKFDTAEISFNMEKDLRIDIEGTGMCEQGLIITKGNAEISVLLLKSLVDEVQFFDADGKINKISLLKRVS